MTDLSAGRPLAYRDVARLMMPAVGAIGTRPLIAGALGLPARA